VRIFWNFAFPVLQGLHETLLIKFGRSYVHNFSIPVKWCFRALAADVTPGINIILKIVPLHKLGHL